MSRTRVVEAGGWSVLGGSLFNHVRRRETVAKALGARSKGERWKGSEAEVVEDAF